MAEHGGRVPDTVEGLMTLPGVGPYTARAVAAIAFGQRVGAVDTNVRRVLGRVAAGGAEAFTSSEIQALADAVVPADRAGDWTHALMDVGAGPCRVRSPRCARSARPWRGADTPRASAPRSPSPRRWRPRPTAFPATTRWLRGRIVARARDASDGAWVPFVAPIGDHDRRAVREAVAALASEGLLEARDTAEGPEARLPIDA